MNATAPPKRTEWLTPSSVIGFLGMIGMIFTSYSGFRDTTRDELSGLRSQVASNKETLERHEAAIERLRERLDDERGTAGGK